MKNVRSSMNTEEDKDRIGDLPDVLLVHILFFLKTKEAVRTVILSKRWRNLWMSVPKIDLEGEKGKREAFMNVIEKLVTLQGSSGSNMLELSLHNCEVRSDGSQIIRWISVAASHKVQKVDLGLKRFKGTFQLPPCLFACETLKELGIEMSCDLMLPTHKSLSSLKKLSLGCVVFPDEHSTEQIFSGCPVLEELDLWDCSWHNAKAICIDTPMLSRLHIAHGLYSNKDHNYTEFSNDARRCQILIFAANLRFLSVGGELSHDYCFCNSFSLVEASLELLQGFISPRINSFRFYQLLRGVTNVEILELGEDIIEGFMAVEELSDRLPVFSNLIHFTCWFEILDISFEAVLNILRNSPNLDTIIFKSVNLLRQLELEKSGGQDELILDPVPWCFSRHLQRILFNYFHGKKSEIAAIAFFLEHATCLESVGVRFCHIEDQKIKDFQRELLSLPKASTDCEMEFWKLYEGRLPDLESSGSEQGSC